MTYDDLPKGLATLNRRRRPSRAAEWPDRPLAPLSALLIAGAATLLVLTVLAWGAWHGLSPLKLLRDPAQHEQIWPLTGLLSHLGVLLLWSGAVVCLFGAIAVRDRATALFLLLFGAFAVVVALDDLFMLHEYFWPRRGVPTEVAQLGLGLFGAGLLVAFRRRLLGLAHLALHLAIGLLGISLAVDLLVTYSVASTVVEDTAKFTGYALWTGYWAGVVRVALRT